MEKEREENIREEGWVNSREEEGEKIEKNGGKGKGENSREEGGENKREGVVRFSLMRLSL